MCCSAVKCSYKDADRYIFPSTRCTCLQRLRFTLVHIWEIIPAVSTSSYPEHCMALFEHALFPLLLNMVSHSWVVLFERIWPNLFRTSDVKLTCVSDNNGPIETSSTILELEIKCDKTVTSTLPPPKKKNHVSGREWWNASSHSRNELELMLRLYFVVLLVTAFVITTVGKHICFSNDVFWLACYA